MRAIAYAFPLSIKFHKHELVTLLAQSAGEQQNRPYVPTELLAEYASHFLSPKNIRPCS
jgi:hypothetical protein